MKNLPHRGEETINFTRIVSALTALLVLAPLAHAVPPPAYVGIGLGTGTHTFNDVVQCSDASVVVTIVKYPYGENAYQVTWNFGPPGTSNMLCQEPYPGSVNVTGTPTTGFVWAYGCDKLTIGPLGSATEFEYSACLATGTLVQRAIVSF